jgi:eukaryotic-like serine/threonine-protein kinase
MDGGTHSIGPYRLLEPLGRGGMGVVYRAVHRPSGQTVALKTVRSPSEWALASLRREIHALARLRHPQIVRILDEGVEQGLPWYAMELLEGTTLRHFAAGLFGSAETQSAPFLSAGTLAEASAQMSGPVSSLCWWTRSLGAAGAGATPQGSSAPAPMAPPQRSALPAAAGGKLLEALTLVRRLCAPVAFLHGEGIVHRDLKLENVLLRGSGEWGVGSRGAQSARSSAGSTEDLSGRVARAAASDTSGAPHCSSAAPPTPYSLRPTPCPVLVDFGLISRFGAQLSREALQMSDSGSGTISSMAPEQIAGELVDARADLYALGCILYELIAGRPPFEGPTPAAVLYGHLREQALPPSELACGVPAQLDELVLRLLAKEPRARLGYADDVAAALDGILKALSNSESDAETQRRKDADREPSAADPSLPGCVVASLRLEDEEGPKPRAYLYRPGLAGRDEALEPLVRQLDALELGRGAFVLVGGESGSGKTRLALELSHQAERRQFGVITGECVPLTASVLESPAGGGGPLHPLRPLLRHVADRCRGRGRAETERLLGRRGKLLALYEPALSGLAGQEAHPEPADLPAKEARPRLFGDLTETLGALAGAGSSDPQPLLLILDDLHLADDLSLGWLELLLRSGALERMPVLVVGTYRTEEAGAELKPLIELPQAATVTLGRVDEAAVGSMIGDMLALRPAPAAFARYLARQSEGNPFFVAEYLRTAVAEGLLYRDASGRWQVHEPGEEAADETAYEALPLPGSLRELVGRRLEGLSPQGRHLLHAGAVLGRELDSWLVEELAGTAGAQGLEAVQELLARHVLEEAAEGRLRFAHDKLREVAYEQIEESLRKQLHRAAAMRLEGAGELQPASQRDESLAVLGQHWDRAGAPEKARQYYLAAARRAASRYAYGEAERCYRAFLALVQQPTSESVLARNELARDVLVPPGRNPEARLEYGRALQEATSLQDWPARGTSLSGLAELHYVAGRSDEAFELYERALAAYRQAEDRGSEADVLRVLGVLHLEQGRHETARPLLEQVLGISREIGDRSQEGKVLSNLATICLDQGRPEEARSLYEQALAIAREVGDRRAEGRALQNLAVGCYHRGLLHETRTYGEQALAIRLEIGDRRGEAITLISLGELYRALGQDEQALLSCEQALELFRKVGDRRWEGLTLCVLARTEAERGSVEQAHARWQLALERLREVDDRHRESTTLLELAWFTRLALDKLDEAERMALEAEAALQELGDSVSVAACLCQRGHVALARGRSGHKFLQQARRLASAARAGPESLLGRALGRLERAVEATRRRRPLFRGECVEDIPSGLRAGFIARHWL